jgi:protocatechuate 3,4-dioxygenase beta subunit
MTSDQDPREHVRLRRRDALRVAGGLGVGLGGLLATGRLPGVGGGDGSAEAASCVLAPEVTEGPYWIDTSLTRRDVRGGRPGLRLDLVFAVQNARTCAPIAGADVEIWHCDATGVYSGFQQASQGGPGGGSGPTDTTRYLRGHQKSDAHGRARFTTIFPGWYRGRTPHIHLKVHVGGHVVHTGQAFFDERTTARVYQRAPYSSHGQPDTKHAADMIFAQAGGSRAVLALAGLGSGRTGYRGALTLGVAT